MTLRIQFNIKKLMQDKINLNQTKINIFFINYNIFLWIIPHINSMRREITRMGEDYQTYKVSQFFN